jgi:hypothetical protein
MDDYWITWLKLTPEKETEYRQWARDNYKPGQPINGTWHPVKQDECVKINFEKVSIGLTIEQQDIIINES